MSFPASLNTTQTVRFGHGNNSGPSGVPNIQSYSTNGPLTSSTQLSGMSSATAPNAHLIFSDQAQSAFVNTATIPMIKNGEPVDQMKNAYNNSQMLDRLFL